MYQIRYGVFETNSSSTHSLSVLSEEKYQQWSNGEMFLCSSTNELFTLDDLKEMIKNGEYEPDDYDGVEIDELNLEQAYYILKDWGEDIYSEEDYFNEGDEESYCEDFTTEHGDKIVIFGKYGYDS